jgi:hypothetical protein
MRNNSNTKTSNQHFSTEEPLYSVFNAEGELLRADCTHSEASALADDAWKSPDLYPSAWQSDVRIKLQRRTTH